MLGTGLHRVELGGAEQAIHVRGRDPANPPLLYVDGGPVLSELGWVRHYNAPLEEAFTVVNWEQRGTALSYRAARPWRALTVERFVEDLLELADLVCERLAHERVFLVAHSWGTVLAVEAAQRRPDQVHAYVGIGQVVAVPETDLRTYQFALSSARESGNARLARRLKRAGPPPYRGLRAGWRMLRLETAAQSFDRFEPSSDYRAGAIRRALASPEYGLRAKLDWFRGMALGMKWLYPQLQGLDFAERAPRLEVPVILATGRHEKSVWLPLIERWYEQLDAPSKELVWFEGSGHSPCFEQPDEFNRLLIDRVRPLART